MNNETIEQNEDVPFNEQLELLQREVDEWKDTATRRAADYANLQRRTQIERMELIAHASESVITRMLPVLDDLHAAVDSSRTSSDVAALRTGIEMIYVKALKIFEDAGVGIIDADPGQPFSVQYHEALMHSPSEYPEGHIIQGVQRGYQLHNKVLRHAKVITSAGLPSHTDDLEGKQ